MSDSASTSLLSQAINPASSSLLVQPVEQQKLEQKKRQFFSWIDYPHEKVHDFSIKSDGSYEFYFNNIYPKELKKLFEDVVPPLSEGQINWESAKVTLTSQQVNALQERYNGFGRKFYAILLTLLACALFVTAAIYGNPADNALAFFLGTGVGGFVGLLSLYFARKFANRSNLLNYLNDKCRPKRGWFVAGLIVSVVSLVVRIFAGSSVVTPLISALMGLGVLVMFFSGLMLRKQKNFGFDSDQAASVAQASSSSNGPNAGAQYHPPTLGLDQRQSSGLSLQGDSSSLPSSLSYVYDASVSQVYPPSSSALLSDVVGSPQALAPALQPQPLNASISSATTSLLAVPTPSDQSDLDSQPGAPDQEQKGVAPSPVPDASCQPSAPVLSGSANNVSASSNTASRQVIFP